jgi:dihydropteroate synthase
MGQVTNQPLLMGVVNVTTDSFSDGGRFDSRENAVQHALELCAHGADWIDIGGESTRPGATPVPVDLECARVLPVIHDLVAARPDIKISVDTSKSIVAELAIEAGAAMINDVTAGRYDPRMFEVVASRNVPIVLMHMQGEPRTMQINPTYSDVVAEVREDLAGRVAAARAAGVQQILVDPGIGFGKTLDHNLALLRNLSAFASIADGTLLGISRKRFIGEIVGIQTPSERDTVTSLLHALLWHAPVGIIRVHNIALHAQLRKLADALLS